MGNENLFNSKRHHQIARLKDLETVEAEVLNKAKGKKLLEARGISNMAQLLKAIVTRGKFDPKDPKGKKNYVKIPSIVGGFRDLDRIILGDFLDDSKDKREETKRELIQTERGIRLIKEQPCKNIKEFQKMLFKRVLFYE